MSDLNKTLADRQKTHGDFQQVAKVAESLMCSIEFQRLSASQSFAVRMIVGKLARIVCGNPNEPDHWHDIAGYAALVENELLGKSNNNTENTTIDMGEKLAILAEFVSKNNRDCSYQISGEMNYKNQISFFGVEKMNIDDLEILGEGISFAANKLGLIVKSCKYHSAGPWSALDYFFSEV